MRRKKKRETRSRSNLASLVRLCKPNDEEKTKKNSIFYLLPKL